jgi:O-antigen ligase
MIGNNLLLGVGFGQFISNMGESAPFTSNGIALMQPVHNIFLLFLSENGILGAVIFIIPILYYLVLKFKSGRFGNWFNKRFFIKFCIFWVLLFFGSFDHFYLTLPQGQIQLIVMVLILYI